jgi:hypothetical protein
VIWPRNVSLPEILIASDPDFNIISTDVMAIIPPSEYRIPSLDDDRFSSWVIKMEHFGELIAFHIDNKAVISSLMPILWESREMYACLYLILVIWMGLPWE